MEPLSSQKIKTGILVLVGFLLLLLAVYFIGQQKNLFDKTFTIQVKYKNVSGLQVGNFVRFTGINIGTVDNIKILNDSTAQVNLSVQKSVQKYIKTDAVATITSDGLMGDKLIQIVHGSDTASLVKDNDFIIGQNPVEMNTIMTKMTVVAENAAVLTDNLADIVYKINTGEGSLGRLINSDKLAKNLEGTLASSQQTVQSIKKSADGFSDNMEAVKHNFLLRGYFKKKERKRVQDSIAKAKAIVTPDPKKKQ